MRESVRTGIQASAAALIAGMLLVQLETNAASSTDDRNGPKPAFVVDHYLHQASHVAWDPETTPSTPIPTASPTSPLNADVEPAGVDDAAVVTYLEALDTVDSSPALAVASPGSAAWRYADHQVGLEIARRANGLEASADIVSPRGDGRFQSCSSPVTPVCAVFGDFVADSAARISTFTVDGIDISTRLGDPSDEVRSDAVTANVASSYRTVTSDVLVVVVTVDTKSDRFIARPARYTDPSGHDIDQVDAVAPSTFPAGSTSTIALVFPGVDPGGHLTWELSKSAGGGAPIELSLDVPALGSAAAQAVPPDHSTAASTATPLTATTLADVEPAVTDALNVAIGTAFGASDGGFPEPDIACLNTAIAELPPSTRDAVRQLTPDPTLFEAMNNELAHVIANAYVGCVDEQALAGFLAAVQTFAVQELDCLVETWAETLTPNAVAASLAYGHGLDDLPDDTINRLTLTTAGCVPEQWWIDDETTALARAGLSDQQATCVATTIVDAFGVNPIIRRRILGLDLLPIPQPELDAVDLPARCNMEFPTPAQLNAPAGACLTGFGEGTAQTQRVDCSQPHNAEVVTIVDLDAEFAAWPGAQTLRDHVASTCVAELEALDIDPTQYAAGWDIPNRLAWERQHRLLTCTLLRTDYSTWTGSPAGTLRRSG